MTSSDNDQLLPQWRERQGEIEKDIPYDHYREWNHIRDLLVCKAPCFLLYSVQEYENTSISRVQESSQSQNHHHLHDPRNHRYFRIRRQSPDKYCLDRKST